MFSIAELLGETGFRRVILRAEGEGNEVNASTTDADGSKELIELGASRFCTLREEKQRETLSR